MRLARFPLRTGELMAAMFLVGITWVPGVTTLVVASRPSTIALADEVVFLVGGRVAAQGGHDELLTTQPLYRNLVEAYERDRGAA